jgi:putative transposase
MAAAILGAEAIRVQFRAGARVGPRVGQHPEMEGLFRYSLIRELSDPGLRPRRRGEMVRALAELEHVRTDGERVRVSAVTLWRWLRAWRQGGFPALVPSPRRQPAMIPAPMLEAAVVLRREAPARTAAQVSRILAEGGVGRSAAELCSGTSQAPGAELGPDGSAPHAYGRFEAQAFGERWTGDGLHGPMVEGRTAILFAFIDDWSRAVVGWRWGMPSTPCGWRRHCAGGWSRSVSRNACFVDNGSPFISAPFHRTLATLGIRIIHPRAGHAPSGARSSASSRPCAASSWSSSRRAAGPRI